MTREDLLAWKDNPATQWVLEALDKEAGRLKDEWMGFSWDAGNSDERLLVQNRSRVAGILALRNSSYEDFCTMRGEEVEE